MTKNEIPPVTLGYRVEELRVSYGWNQQELAQKAGSTQVTIANIESGETEKPRNLDRLAEVLGVDRKYLEEGLYSRIALENDKIKPISPELQQFTKDRVNSILSEVVPEGCTLSFNQLNAIAHNVVEIVVVLLESNQTISNLAVAKLINSKFK